MLLIGLQEELIRLSLITALFFIVRFAISSLCTTLSMESIKYNFGDDISGLMTIKTQLGLLSGLGLDVNASLLSSRTFYPYFDGNTAVKDSVVRPFGTVYSYDQAYRTKEGSVLDMPKATYNVIVEWDYLGF